MRSGWHYEAGTMRATMLGVPGLGLVGPDDPVAQ